MIDRALDLFEHLSRAGEPALLVELRRPNAEREYVEFKQSAFDHRTADKLKDTDDSGHMARAISGFFNIEGGVLVWGIIIWLFV